MRLVCTVLSAVYEYFGTGSSAQKMDDFLVYFQRYCLAKQAVRFQSR